MNQPTDLDPAATADTAPGTVQAPSAPPVF